MTMQGQRLVIFGCGYVGSALAGAARAAGAQVTALTRNPERAATLRADGIADVVVGDLLGPDWQDRLPAAPEHVVNCVSAGGRGTDSYHGTYVEGMRSILAWAAAGSRPVGTLLYTGSTGVYPQSGGDARVDELSPTESGDERGETLLQAENELRAAAAGVERWFILRLAGIYGPGRQTLLDQLRTGAAELPGPVSHRMNLAHRDDIVAAILACLTAPAAVRNEVYNVCDGSPAPKLEVVRWLCGQLGRPVPVFTGGGSDRRRGGPADRFIVADRLRERLGWRPQFPTYRAGFAPLLRQL